MCVACGRGEELHLTPSECRSSTRAVPRTRDRDQLVMSYPRRERYYMRIVCSRRWDNQTVLNRTATSKLVLNASRRAHAMLPQCEWIASKRRRRRLKRSCGEAKSPHGAMLRQCEREQRSKRRRRWLTRSCDEAKPFIRAPCEPISSEQAAARAAEAEMRRSEITTRRHAAAMRADSKRAGGGDGD